MLNKRKEELKLQGKCIGHPNENIVPGYAECQKCLDNNKLRKQKNIDNGKCSSHKDRDLAPGKRKCQECIENSYWQKIYKKYKITKEQYFIECEKRNYCCDLCNKKCLTANSGNNKRDIFVIDHDHKTKKFRGLLCNACNTTIGMFNENIDRLKYFIDNISNYLNKENNET